ncbi:uncharacterized protein L199_000018 [Kwoniella botswanensis]|uniref:uncharacterized protein n=1 Tax=Kwoniella botswanensis TaxID=1268659 RepID=UPI00315D87D7
MRPIRCLISLCVLYAARAASAASPGDTTQIPWSSKQPEDSSHHPKNPTSIFIDHFSASRSGTDTYLQTQIAALYSNHSVVTTDDIYFDIFRFAAGDPASIAIREIDDLEPIKRVVFVKPSRRREGEGTVAARAVFGGWEVAWKNKEFKVIVATWAEAYRQVTQWHIITDEPDAARQFIRSCANYCSSFRDVVWVFEQGSWRPDRGLWESVQKASWEDVVLEDRFKTALQSDYRSFLKSEKTYKDLGVPWKRGLIFLGPPGNGKTISLKALMKEVKVPSLYVKSFHSWAGDEKGIRDIFSRARAEAPCVLVLEDLDSLITDQNRSFFLNEVDGLEDNDGLLLIGTTNHFDRLDPALSSRPSRFDRKYTFPDPSRAQRRDYAKWWQDNLRSNEKIDFPDSLPDEFADKTGNFSFAYMKEAFVSTLLTIAGRNENDPKKLDFPALLLDQVHHLRHEFETTDAMSSSSSSANSARTWQNDGVTGYGWDTMQWTTESMIFQIPWVELESR